MMDEDLFKEDLYNKFDYVKNRNINKTNIQEVLKSALFFNFSEKFDILKEYLSDYLGINIFILKF